MAIVNNVNEVLHRIRVKLYPNYLPKAEGAYIARVDSEATLTIEDVCAALKNRGGFTGNYADLVEYVRQFLGEACKTGIRRFCTCQEIWRSQISNAIRQSRIARSATALR